MKFRHILFPLDFSERCKSVAPFVAAMAKRDGACLTLAHIVDAPIFWGGAADAAYLPDLNLPRLIEEAEHRLTFFAGECFPGITTKQVVDSGDPGSCIIEIARESGADLIMMPTRGRGLFRVALLGSTVVKVLHDAECPVWTAGHDAALAPASSGEWRKIVCAVDTSDEAVRLIRYAKELASSHNSSIHLVHAVPAPAETRPERYLDRDFENFLKDSARQWIEAKQKEAGSAFRVCVEAGKVSAIIAEVAERDQTDLVLIGRGALPHLAGRLRTHVYSIIRDAPCPVLSV